MRQRLNCEEENLRAWESLVIKISSYYNHHEEIRSITDRIKSELDINIIENNPEPITRIIRELFGRFSMHLALEDSILYPQLAISENKTIRDTATRFQLEMAGMKFGFEDYKTKWPDPRSISSNPHGFIDETKQILSSLEIRIRREELELYPMLNKFSKG